MRYEVVVETDEGNNAMLYAKNTATALLTAEKFLELATWRLDPSITPDEGEGSAQNYLIEALSYATQAGLSWWPGRRDKACLVWIQARNMLLDCTDGWTS